MKHFFSILILFTSFAHAKVFSTSYASFETPKEWICTPDGASWICSNTDKKLKREALIIMTAKLSGGDDNLNFYERYLKTKKNYSFKGRKVSSKVIRVKQNILNSHRWVDGFHLASEVPNYYTRYIVTTKNNLAVLISFTASKSKWSKYSNDFDRTINSVRLLNVSKAVQQLRLRKNKNYGNKKSVSVSSFLEGVVAEEGDFLDDGSSDGFFSSLFSKDSAAQNLGILFIIAILIFLGIRILRKKLGSKSNSNEAPSGRRRRR